MAIDSQQVDLRQAWMLWDRERSECVGYVYDCVDKYQAEEKAYDMFGPMAGIGLVQVHKKQERCKGDMPHLVKAFVRSGLPSQFGVGRDAHDSWRGDPRPQGPEFG